MGNLFTDEASPCPLCGAAFGACTPDNHGETGIVPFHALPTNTEVPPLAPGTRVGYWTEVTPLRWGRIADIELDVFGRESFVIEWDDGTTQVVSRKIVERGVAAWEWGVPGWRPAEVGPSIVSAPQPT